MPANYIRHWFVDAVLKTPTKIALLAMALVGNSYAQDQYVVSYSLAELSTIKGMEDVHARILRAAIDYCPSYSQIRSFQDVDSCVDGVVNDLVLNVNHPTFSRLVEADFDTLIIHSLTNSRVLIDGAQD